MAQRTTLTERQLTVLRWIGKGCPTGVMEDHFHRISAAALRRRGLVRTSGRGGAWKATITKAGVEYIDAADGLNPPAPRQANVSVTQQLVDDVRNAGRPLRFPRQDRWKRDGVDYARRAELAQNYGKVPAGLALVVSNVSDAELEISLVDAFGAHNITPEPVPVPEKVARYHPVARKLREDKDHHEVSRAAMPRALRILQGLVVEAERRGHSVCLVNAAAKRTDYGRSTWTGANDGHIAITIDNHAETIRFYEEGLPSRARWEQQNTRWRYGEPRGAPLAEYEENATGRLCLTITSGYARPGRSATFADRQSWTLEARLPDLLHELEVRAAEAAERKAEAQRQAEQRQRDWEAAMDRARARYVEHLRAAEMERQASAWTAAGRVRDYCAAVEAIHAGDERAAAWIAWGRTHADAIDPLRVAPAAPELPESIPAEDLKPFLERGWSPYSADPRGW